MTPPLVGMALGVVLGLAVGLRIGARRGADRLADEWATAALDAPDAVELAWPVAPAREARPS